MCVVACSVDVGMTAQQIPGFLLITYRDRWGVVYKGIWRELPEPLGVQCMGWQGGGCMFRNSGWLLCARCGGRRRERIHRLDLVGTYTYMDQHGARGGSRLEDIEGPNPCNGPEVTGEARYISIHRVGGRIQTGVGTTRLSSPTNL